jgi:hypothetical protein
MTTGQKVSAQVGREWVDGSIILSTTVSGERMHYVAYNGGTCWFNEPLLRPRRTEQMSLF